MSLAAPDGAALDGAALADGRYAVVDVLRGVSILLVVLLHIQIRIPLEHAASLGAVPALWRLLCTNGNEGVRMFFVISGFLITHNSLRRWGSLPRLDVRRFYQRRFARVAPTLIVLLVVLSVLHFARVDGYTIDPQRASYARALIAALTFHVNWLEASRHFYLPASWDVLWSLSVEEVFYLLFPLARFAYRWPLAGHALVLALFVASASFRCMLVDQPMWQSKAYLSCVDAIALGCMTAVVSHGRVLSRAAAVALLAGSGAVALGVLAYAKLPAFSFVTDRDLHLSVLALATAGLLVAGVRVRLGASLTALLGPLMACGRLSYEIYLTHMFVVLAAVSAYHEHRPPAAASYPLLGLVLVAAWGLGALVERWISTLSRSSSRASRWVLYRHH